MSINRIYDANTDTAAIMAASKSLDPSTEDGQRKFFEDRAPSLLIQKSISSLLIPFLKGKRVGIGCDVFWNPKEDKVAWTDGRKMHINAANDMIRRNAEKDLTKQWDMVKGFSAHEAAHICWTDFTIMQKMDDEAKEGRFYPEPADAPHAEDVKKYFADKNNVPRVRNVIHSYSNILEDGFIELAWMATFVGSLTEGLYSVRDIHYDDILSFEKHKEKLLKAVAEEKTTALAMGASMISEEEIEIRINYALAMQQLLCYAKYGEIKVDDPETYKGVVMSCIKDAMPWVDQAVVEYNPLTRQLFINESFCCLWPVIKPYLDTLPDQKDMDSMAKMMSRLLEEAIEGMSSSGSGSGSGSSGRPLSASSPKLNRGAGGDSTSEAREKTKEKMGMSSSGSGSGKKSDEKKDGKTGNGGKSDKDGKDKDDKSGKDGKDGKSGSEDKSDKDGKGSKGGKSGDDSKDGADSDSNSDNSAEINPGSSSSSPKKQAVHGAEGGRIADHDGSVEDMSSGDEEVTFEEIEADGDYSRSAQEVSDLLGKMISAMASKALEERTAKELTSEIATMDMGSAHKGISCKVQRIAQVTPEMKESYAETAKELEGIAKKLARKVSQKLKEREQSDKMEGLFLGRLDTRALLRNDGKMFYRNKKAEDLKKMAVGILVDESGSMCWGSRATSARAAAIVLYNFCEILELPVMVYGHTADESGWGSVTLLDYSDFKGGYDKDDKYRLMDISARSNNRDGYALKYMYEKIKSRPEEQKIVFVISDGQPAASGYSGRNAEDDMRKLRDAAFRKGIVTFAAAIGNDKDNIQRIYREGFLDISDLNELPVTLTNLLVRYLKK